MRGSNMATTHEALGRVSEDKTKMQIACVEKPLWAKDRKEQEEVFYCYIMPGEGECGYHALGIPRAEVAKKFLEHSDKEIFREMVQDDIFTNRFFLPDAMRQEPEVNEFFKLVDQQLELDRQNAKDVHGIKDALKKACKTKPVFEAYVKHYIGKKGNALTFAEQGNSCLDVIAILFNLNIKVWLRHEYEPHLVLGQQCGSLKGRLVNMLFQGDVDGGHFDLLSHENNLVIFPVQELDLPKGYPHKLDGEVNDEKGNKEEIKIKAENKPSIIPDSAKPEVLSNKKPETNQKPENPLASVPVQVSDKIVKKIVLRNNSSKMNNLFISPEALPYLALSLGFLQFKDFDAAIRFATQEIDLIQKGQSKAPHLSQVKTLFCHLEAYFGSLIHRQDVVFLPELGTIYRTAIQFSEGSAKIVDSVFLSLLSRNAAYLEEIALCSVTQIKESKELLAQIKEYAAQETTVDALVNMTRVLLKNPKDFEAAAKKGLNTNISPRAIHRLFNEKEYERRARYRGLFMVALMAEEQAEEDKLEDEQFILAIQKALVDQKIKPELARAITIVYCATHFINENENIPKASDLKQAAEWLEQSERNKKTLPHQAFQVTAFNLTRSMTSGLSKGEALKKTEEIRQSILSGKPVKEEIVTESRFEELIPTAFTAVQDYAAISYLSPSGEIFGLERSSEGNGLYEAVIKGLKKVLPPDDSIHLLSAEILSTIIREKLGQQPEYIVDKLSSYIFSEQLDTEIPMIFSKEIEELRGKLKDSKAVHEKVLADISEFLKSAPKRYYEFIETNPNIGGDIELNLIAERYYVQIVKYTHLGEMHKPINPKEQRVVPLFYSIYQNCYHALLPPDRKVIQEDTSEDYIKRGAKAALGGEFAESGWMLNTIAFCAGILSLRKPLFQEYAPIQEEELRIAIRLGLHHVNELRAKRNSDYVSAFIQSIEEQQKKAISDYAHQVVEGVERQHREALVQYSKDVIAAVENRHRESLSEYVNQVLNEYRKNGQAFFQDKKQALEKNYSLVISKLEAHKVALGQTYQQQIQLIDKHYKDALDRNIQAYREHEERVRKAKKKARRKRFRRIAFCIVGVAVAMFVAPTVAAMAFPKGGIAAAVTKGAISGGIISGFSGQNPLKGALQGAVFAGVGHIADGALKSVNMAQFAKEAIKTTAIASVHTAMNGGNLFKNVVTSVAVNSVSNLVIPDRVGAANSSNRRELFLNSSNMAARAFVSGGIAAIIGRQDLANSLTSAVMSGGQAFVQGYAGGYGERAASKHYVKHEAATTHRSHPQVYRKTQAQLAKPSMPSARNAKQNLVAHAKMTPSTLKKDIPKSQMKSAKPTTASVAAKERFSLGSPKEAQARMAESRRRNTPAVKNSKASNKFADTMFSAIGIGSAHADEMPEVITYRVNPKDKVLDITQPTRLNSNPGPRVKKQIPISDVNFKLADAWEGGAYQTYTPGYSRRQTSYALPRGASQRAHPVVGSRESILTTQALRSHPTAFTNRALSGIPKNESWRTSAASDSMSLEIVESFDYRGRNLPCKPLSAEESQYRTRLMKEAVIRGVINLADLPYNLNPFKNAFDPSNLPLSRDSIVPVYTVERPSEKIHRYLRNHDIDLHQAPPRNSVEKGMTFILEFGSESIAGGAALKFGQFGAKGFSYGFNQAKSFLSPKSSLVSDVSAQRAHTELVSRAERVRDSLNPATMQEVNELNLGGFNQPILTIYQANSGIRSVHQANPVISTRFSGGRSIGDLIEAEERLAEKIYSEIRTSRLDSKKIAENIGIPEFQVRRIKEHIFFNKHQLDHGLGVRRFHPDIQIAEAWKRLESGVHTELDLLIIKHEHFECRFEGIFKTNYRIAHEAAERAGHPSGLKNTSNAVQVKGAKKWEY